MKILSSGKWIHGRKMNRMISINWDTEERSWCDRYYAVIEKRKRAVESALLRHWQKGGQVIEDGFSGWKERMPGQSPDSLRDAANLAELLANRCQGFNLSILLVSTGPFPVADCD